MSIKTCDVLNLEWSSSGRDREVAGLICYALRRKGYKVIEESIFNYKYCIEKYRPRLLYIADPKGARWNYEVAKYAHALGIPMVSFTAEGNLTNKSAERMFWGNIADRKLYEVLNVQWSRRDRDIALQVAPEVGYRVKVGGAVGFDRYKIYRLYNRADWMREYRLDFERMIGYASWSFDMFYREDRWTKSRQKLFGPERYAQFREDRVRVNGILRSLIEANPSTLFLIKEHPGVVDVSKSEMDGLADYPNVLVVKNEESIADCINACNIWLAFESTTALEAWLLDKPTIFINPTGTDFPRGPMFEGCLVVDSFEALQGAVDEFLDNGAIKEFDDKSLVRRQIVQDTIQWADGKNHMRVAHLFEAILRDSPTLAYRLSAWQRLLAYWQLIQFRVGRVLPVIPRFQKSAAFSYAEMARRQARYGEELARFYQEHSLTREDIEELQRINGSSGESSREDSNVNVRESR